MAKSFRPTISIGRQVRQFPTYAEVKKNMVDLLKESPNSSVTVYRHRRGEWGEWFEHWGWGGMGKPMIISSGWL
jgi:hypothetical protein